MTNTLKPPCTEAFLFVFIIKTPNFVCRSPAKPKKLKKNIPEAELIKGIKEEGALRQHYTGLLYEQYFDFIYAGKKKYKLSFEQAHDAFGDAVLKVCRQIQKGAFDGGGKLPAYLFRAFCNRCVDNLRKNASSIMQEDIAEHYDLPSPAKGILAEMELQEKWQELKFSMDELGEKCKRLLLEIEYYGYSQEEVAQRMGYNKASTVANMKYRCLKRLKEILHLKTGKS